MAGATPPLVEQLAALRTELTDLAFTLERRGRLDAADVANAVSARVSELCEEFGAVRLDPGPGDFPSCEPSSVRRNGVTPL